MSGNRVFDADEDFGAAIRILQALEEEHLVGTSDHEALDKLRRVATRSEPLDRFDRAELTSLFHHYMQRVVEHAGIERLFGERMGKDLPTIPPPDASAARISKQPPQSSADRIVGELRSMALRTTKAQRHVGNLTSKVSDLKFLYGRLQGIMTDLSWISSEGQVPTAPASELSRFTDYLDRCRQDLDDILFIAGVEDDLVLQDVVDRARHQIDEVLPQSRGEHFERLTALARQLFDASGLPGLAAVRVPLIEAIVRARLVLRPYPVLISIESSSQARKEMETISLELDEPALSRRHAVADPALSEQINAAIVMAQSMLRFLQLADVQQHVSMRIQQLNRIEEVALRHPRTPLTLLGIDEDLRMIGRLLRAQGGEEQETIDELRKQVFQEIVVAMGMCDPAGEEGSNLRLLRQGIMNPKNFEEMMQHLQRAHALAVAKVTPYDMPEGRGSGEGGTGSGPGGASGGSRSGEGAGDPASSTDDTQVVRVGADDLELLDAPFGLSTVAYTNAGPMAGPATFLVSGMTLACL